MARTSKIIKLTPAQQGRVEGLLRRYQYGCFDLIKDELAIEGISVSRSGLHRYAQQLRALDNLNGNAPDSTVIVIIDLRTGEATQVRTAATPVAVVRAIGDLAPATGTPETVSADGHAPV